MTCNVLIIGPTGSVGRAIATAFLGHGWKVSVLHRDPVRARGRFAENAAIQWHRGDAMSRDDVLRAAEGVDVIIHAVNPPGYRNWKGLARPMLENTIAAAKATGARIMFPGNVYNYGPDALPLVSENAPQTPRTRKGRIRVDMERALRQGAVQGARSIVVRAGDFFGANGASSWFEAVLVKPGKPVRSVTYPGKHGAGHNWAYLPDLAETFVRVAERERELGAFETFHFGGHFLARGVDMAKAIARAGGNPNTPIRRMPWFAVYAAAPFNVTMREVLEMRYLWRETLQLDNRKLVAFLGEEPHTPLTAAVERTLMDLGCIGPDTPEASGSGAMAV